MFDNLQITSHTQKSLVKPRKKKSKALWVKLYPAQAKKLHPDRQVAGGIKARSTPEHIRMGIYLAIKRLYLAKNPYCQCCPVIEKVDVIDCNGLNGLDIHHRFGKEGWLLVDTRTWSGACRNSHSWIDSHRAEARKLKLLPPLGSWNKIT